MRPAAEARKQRAEKGEAYLSFRVNKTDIVEDLYDNARELAKITQTIDLVRNDKNVEITGINIHGYASPDGPYANNERLARERAASLKNYVARLYPIDAKLYSSNSTPEDWNGFSRWQTRRLYSIYPTPPLRPTTRTSAYVSSIRRIMQ